MKLKTLQQQGRYGLLDLHQVSSLAEWLGLEISIPSNQAVLKAVVAELIDSLSPHASGLVLDPDIGLSQIRQKSSSTGLLLPLQVTGAEVDPLALPTLSPDWGVEQIANNYGVAMIELFYNPAEPEALLKKQMVAELMDYCRYLQIDLAIRLRLFSPTGEILDADAFQAAQIQALQELRTICHLLVLDNPGTVLAAATITAELDIPWLVWLEAPKYDQLKDQLRTCVESGARGYMVGSNLWPELGNLRRKDTGLDMAAIKELCQTTLRDRMIELTRIVAEEVV